MIFREAARALQFREPFQTRLRTPQHRNRNGFVQVDNRRGRNTLQFAIQRGDASPIGIL